MIHVVGWSCICLCVGAEAQACVPTMKANTEVPDEEASQTKALSYMFDTDIVGLCGWEDPDDAHPKWNAFKKSVRQSNLEIAQLKGTVLANWQFTPFNTMKSKHTAQEALQMRLRDETVENPSWYQERGEMITRDRLMSQLQAEEYLDNEELMKQDWEDAATSTGRPVFATSLCPVVVSDSFTSSSTVQIHALIKHFLENP